MTDELDLDALFDAYLQDGDAVSELAKTRLTTLLGPAWHRLPNAKQRALIDEIRQWMIAAIAEHFALRIAKSALTDVGMGNRAFAEDAQM